MVARRSRPGQSARAEVAQAAARLLADGHAVDLDAARRKAARELGVEGTRDLPDNLEIHRATVDYLALFGGHRHAERIARLRRAAQRALRFLAPFQPALVGPVLYGTAGEHTPVSLHLRSDEFEAVIRFLLEHRLPYRLEDAPLRLSGGGAPERATRIVLDLFDEAFELSVLPAQGGRQALSQLDGKPMPRADDTALAELIASGEVFPAVHGRAAAMNAPR